MTSCTMPWAQEQSSQTTLSAEVPSQAKAIDGYEYPAIPLDEFNKMNSASGN